MGNDLGFGVERTPLKLHASVLRPVTIWPSAPSGRSVPGDQKFARNVVPDALNLGYARPLPEVDQLQCIVLYEFTRRNAGGQPDDITRSIHREISSRIERMRAPISIENVVHCSDVRSLGRLEPVTPRQFILFIEQNKKDGAFTYDRLKAHCSLRLGDNASEGCLMQAVQAEKVLGGKAARDIYNNLALQIVAKVGSRGCLWTVDLPPQLRADPTVNMTKPILVVGSDVYHEMWKAVRGDDGVVYRQRRSVLALVSAIVDPDRRVHPYVDAKAVTARKETWKKDKAPVQGALELDGIAQSEWPMRAFLEEAKAHFTAEVLPEGFDWSQLEHVIVYRDGVGDTMIRDVLDLELQQIGEAFPEINRQALTYVVVDKRIGARLVIDGNDPGINAPGEFHNCPKGAWVEDPSPRSPPGSFLLNSCPTVLSTDRFCRFIVCQPGNLSAQVLREVTFAFCHNYYTFADSVKVPFPVQMAHKLSDLIGTRSADNPVVHRSLRPSLFFV
eukprot:NODE_312_length_1642_cov_166.138732_g234_i0.p1 GENE.NODE_312_length_1642_cov_166.138732_g234_i0~~NODE_312_length_1642_cov_166.138732_g234_i0.p1  ORF type:complete len:509 (-),score=199.09 NODE_312_length_1642_cov_166.138732_g234_i0:116-1618(-)